METQSLNSYNLFAFFCVTRSQLPSYLFQVLLHHVDDILGHSLIQEDIFGLGQVLLELIYSLLTFFSFADFLTGQETFDWCREIQQQSARDKERKKKPLEIN